LPQLAHSVRSVGLPPARDALPLTGMTDVVNRAHKLQVGGHVAWSTRWNEGQDRRSRSRTDQMSIPGNPPPDEQLAAVTGTPKLAADVQAGKPDAFVSDPAERGRRRRT
jgi:hypothetical protein